MLLDYFYEESGLEHIRTRRIDRLESRGFKGQSGGPWQPRRTAPIILGDHSLVARTKLFSGVIGNVSETERCSNSRSMNQRQKYIGKDSLNFNKFVKFYRRTYPVRISRICIQKN